MTHHDHDHARTYCPGGCIKDLSSLPDDQTVVRPDGSVSCLPCWEIDRLPEDPAEWTPSELAAFNSARLDRGPNHEEA